MNIQRLIELMPYNLAHRRRLEAAVQRHLTAYKAWYAACMASGLVTADRLADAVSRYYNLPRWEYHQTEPVEEELRQIIPASFARHFIVAPLRIIVGRLALATVDPTTVELFDIIARNTGLRVKPCIATYADIESLHRRLYSAVTMVTGEDRRWTVPGTTALVRRGRKVGQRIGVDLLHGICMPPSVPHWLHEDEVEEVVPPQQFRIVDSAVEDIENFYSLDEMPNLAPEGDERR